jgi:uncharacterized protein (DUF1684 family)
MHTIKKIMLTTLLAQPFLGFAQQSAKKENYTARINAWYAHREEELGKFASPLSLVGMVWLKQGENTFGSGKDNDIVLPAGDLPARTGSYLVKGDSIFLQLSSDAAVHSRGRTAISKSDIPTQDSLKYSSGPSSIVLDHGGLVWFVTVNSNKLAVRVLDGKSESHRHFSTVQRYPLDEKWIIKGRFESFAPKTTIAITNVQGITDQRAAAGIVHFTYGGKEYAMEALDRDDKLFFTFADQTGDKGSYAFRFLYVPKPGPDNVVDLDFNKATNPNCAFTRYSPCPLPPAANNLDFAIPAGEKKYVADK